MKSAFIKELNGGLSLSASRLLQLLQASRDGAGLVELFEISDVRSILKYLDIRSAGDRSGPTPRLSDIVLPGTEAAAFVAALLSIVLRVQADLRKTDDPAIVFELSALANRTHRRFELLARPDASTARPSHYPRRRYPEAIYKLLSALCNVPDVHSATLYSTVDIGLVHTACNELIFRRGLGGQRHRTLRSAPVKLEPCPDYVCWDEDDNMYQLPGWPDWSWSATWFGNLPLESDLHVMETSDDQDHFHLVASNSRYAQSRVVLLLPAARDPRSALHPAYKWLWSPMNTFVGVKSEEAGATLSAVQDLARSHGLEPVAASKRLA